MSAYDDIQFSDIVKHRAEPDEEKVAMDFIEADEALLRTDSFADIISPLGVAAFKTEYMQRRPFIIKRGREGWFDSLITVEEVAGLLSSTVFYDSELRVAKDGAVYSSASISKNGVIDRNAVWTAYENGATLVFEHLNRKHPKMLKMMGRCEQEFKIPFRVNAYITPPASKGFDLHYDTHDVLILQVTGRKLWQLHDDPLKLPHEDQPFHKALIPKSRRIAEILLEPGDVLYLPRGYIHSASTNHALSFHLTIGIRSVPLRDICQTAFRRMVFDQIHYRPVAMFRHGRPDTQAIKSDLLRALDELDLRSSFRDSEFSFLRKRTRSLEGGLMELIERPLLDLRSKLVRREGVIYRIVDNNGRIRIHFDSKSLAFLASERAAVEHALSGSVFRPIDLPGMDDEGRISIAATLMKQRLVRLQEKS